VKLRPLLFQIHLYVALAAGLYIAILGVTGAIMTFQDDITRFANADLVYVTPGGPRETLAQMSAAVAKVYPGQAIGWIWMGYEPDVSTRMTVGGSDVYVNPYTGQVLGRNGPVAQTLASVLRAIDFLHTLGGQFMAWITVAALFLLASGIYLWWPRKRFCIRKTGGRSFWYDLHATLGIASVAFAFLLCFTGTMMGFQSARAAFIHAVTGTNPQPDKISPLSHPAPGAQPISRDRALEIAARALPGTIPIVINGQVEQGYTIRLHTPGNPNPNGDSFVGVDAYNGAVLGVRNYSAASAPTRLEIEMGLIHTGLIFGLASKAVMALASLFLAVMLTSGVTMWAKRVPPRNLIPGLAAAGIVTAIAIVTAFAPIL